MQRFAELLDRLVLTPSRNGKLKLMTDFFGAESDPERGYALAAITGDLDIKSVKPAMLRALMASRMDSVLFGYSYDYVGDLAETIALVWPSPDDGKARAAAPPPTLADVVETLDGAARKDGPALVEAWLDRLDSSGRYALLKLVTGGLRVGVSSRLAKQALADFGGKAIAEIEELWHGLEPPYQLLFAWLEGRAEKPVSAAAAPFRPVMLSQALAEPDYERIDPQSYAAEWKWDGIRVQATAERGTRRLYSRTGDDISGAFPDLLDFMTYEGSLDGELLVATPKDARSGTAEVAEHEGPTQDELVVGTFSDLQQRLNRKTVSAAVLKRYPVFLRAYDLLQDGATDLRGLAFAQRREQLESFLARLEPSRFDLSPFVPFECFADLEGLRAAPPHPVIEGLMLKRWDSAYVPGRPKGPWFKWKQDPHLVDAVLMYAQRGHGKRSSFYSDYTFGVWTGPIDAPELVPVGKAYFGFTDAELKQLDKYVRDNTVERFGPVRSVRAEPDHGLVIEVAFEGLARSSRHKSGVAMRFPRVSRLRWDKPAFEADRLETLQAMLPDGPAR
ncbi:cisplatin damage response ATP-dependent DNA ligase [Aurantimonas sp. C2-6-R+9]|uniref:cisplatin damage response ATP-dependent DNA ligase n=1 Tax=unclassified Aurantimonas TaxID=2638230 RepID=UPI002E1821FF|nr:MULTISPECIES: cisplatin damage response ATP-dependent DNA ligase [unclassified Aurantimonas]MEC5291870.1 cisplatin damage response ATP-dependent DNA ligase [Aurantimonas sp. C2-3-R2]MEC5379910.1 cisplatin damage response ATP-dependent DNA ligase [Aurantimonas sp. C2-6-R+9]MEC5412956.1 cisplatin damage response ATP-dependent DNA ligase [Aurantimonas sp. C2-4-R8]